MIEARLCRFERWPSAVRRGQNKIIGRYEIRQEEARVERATRRVLYRTASGTATSGRHVWGNRKDGRNKAKRAAASLRNVPDMRTVSSYRCQRYTPLSSSW
ncbi:hypothetical protein O3G_MSEX009470 [Manduca sexta]|uniref:Uncharacterized protein n=1 Tax=Manduca sexta TaxID=7130 RepID=A0A921ZDH1_MANSE|nr:hypothetical protein O3G_MSEX009470 [Manduca sexta]